MSVRVVVVDDHQPFGVLLSELLIGRGCEVVGEAANGSKALRLVGGCDVAVIDFQMPVLNGSDTTDLVRRWHPNVEVVSCSARDEEWVEQRMLAAGASPALPQDRDPSSRE
jgi:CheY-like chemotaxis protein